MTQREMESSENCRRRRLHFHTDLEMKTGTASFEIMPFFLLSCRIALVSLFSFTHFFHCLRAASLRAL